MLEEALLGAIIGRAGESGQVDQERHFLRGRLGGLGREIKVEVHLALGRGGGMAELEELAAEGGDCCFGCDGHCVFSSSQGVWSGGCNCNGEDRWNK